MVMANGFKVAVASLFMFDGMQIVHEYEDSDRFLSFDHRLCVVGDHGEYHVIGEPVGDHAIAHLILRNGTHFAAVTGFWEPEFEECFRIVSPDVQYPFAPSETSPEFKTDYQSNPVPNFFDVSETHSEDAKKEDLPNVSTSSQHSS
jgi:hypothetical protein